MGSKERLHNKCSLPNEHSSFYKRLQHLTLIGVYTNCTPIKSTICCDKKNFFLNKNSTLKQKLTSKDFHFHFYHRFVLEKTANISSLFIAINWMCAIRRTKYENSIPFTSLKPNNNVFFFEIFYFRIIFMIQDMILSHS